MRRENEKEHTRKNYERKYKEMQGETEKRMLTEEAD